jgi:hypothetical protein
MREAISSVSATPMPDPRKRDSTTRKTETREILALWQQKGIIMDVERIYHFFKNN